MQQCRIAGAKFLTGVCVKLTDNFVNLFMLTSEIETKKPHLSPSKSKIEFRICIASCPQKSHELNMYPISAI